MTDKTVWKYRTRLRWASRPSLAPSSCLTRALSALLATLCWAHISLAHARIQASTAPRRRADTSRSCCDLVRFSCVYLIHDSGIVTLSDHSRRVFTDFRRIHSRVSTRSSTSRFIILRLKPIRSQYTAFEKYFYSFISIVSLAAWHCVLWRLWTLEYSGRKYVGKVGGYEEETPETEIETYCKHRPQI